MLLSSQNNWCMVLYLSLPTLLVSCGSGMWVQSKIAEACQLLEKDLELLGASAIEDKLQVGRIM